MNFVLRHIFFIQTRYDVIRPLFGRNPCVITLNIRGQSVKEAITRGWRSHDFHSMAQIWRGLGVKVSGDVIGRRCQWLVQ